MSLGSLIDKLKDDLDTQVDDIDTTFDVPGATQIGAKDDWIPTQKQLAIMEILKETPMLTDWTLQQLQQLQSRIKNATLRAMYTPDQLRALADSMCESEEDRAMVYANFGLGEPNG